MTYNIYEEAERIVKKYGTRDPFELIECIPSMELWVTDKFPENGLKGFATIQNKTKYIVVNGLLTPEEQRVVAGHELGHIFRHDATLRAHAMQEFNIYNATGRLEREANSFSADFLISDEEVLDEIHSGNADFFSVAKILRIPAPFFAFKLYSLVARGVKLKLPVELDNRFLASRR